MKKPFLRFAGLSCLLLLGAGLEPVLQSAPGFAKKPRLPEKVYFRTARESFNSKYFIALRKGRIWIKPQNQANAKWTALKLPDFIPDVQSISMDDKYIIALDKERNVYTMFGGLGPIKKFKWIRKWGFPFWKGKGIKMPKGTRAWSISFLSPEMDKYLVDTAGNRRRIGQGVTTIFTVAKNGRDLIYLDPWLPIDYSYAACGPERNRFHMAGISTSGSTTFVIGKGGRLYTRLYDFDISGADTVYFRYSWDAMALDSGRAKRMNPKFKYLSKRQLPPEPWVEQPRIKGLVTNRISISKVGPGGVHRLMRVEGKNRNGKTGFYYKDILDKKWKFQNTGLSLKGKVLKQTQGAPALSPPEEVDFRGKTVFKHSFWRQGLEKFKFSVEEFHPYCSPAALNVTTEAGSILKLKLRHLHGLRVARHHYGLKKKPTKMLGAIQVPESVFRNLKTQPKDVQEFIKKYLSNKRFTKVLIKVSAKEILIKRDVRMSGLRGFSIRIGR